MIAGRVPAVLVCHCKAVNDRRIREEIARGARDEFDIARACGAGATCGGCVPLITEILAEYRCAPGCPVSGALRPADGSGSRQREGQRVVVEPAE